VPVSKSTKLARARDATADKGTEQYLFDLTAKPEEHEKCLLPSHLGRDIVGGAAECRRLVLLAGALPAHPEVGDLGVAVTVQQHVVQLQVAVHNAWKKFARKICRRSSSSDEVKNSCFYSLSSVFLNRGVAEPWGYSSECFGVTRVNVFQPWGCSIECFSTLGLLE